MERILWIWLFEKMLSHRARYAMPTESNTLAHRSMAIYILAKELFRACLAPSIYAARFMIRKRWVLLNGGEKLTQPSYQLQDGDRLRITNQEAVYLILGAEGAKKSAINSYRQAMKGRCL